MPSNWVSSLCLRMLVFVFCRTTDLIGDEHMLASDIALETVPGHTPGLTLVRLSGGRHEAIRLLLFGWPVPYRRLVEVLGGVHVANVRIAVDHRPLEAELRDGALQLVTPARTSWSATVAKPTNRFGCAAKTCWARSSFIRFAVSTAIARSGMP